MQHNTLIRRVVMTVMLALGAAPVVQAQTYQYNVFVKGFKPKDATVGAGAGDVSVDPNGTGGTTTREPDVVLSSPRVVFQGNSTDTGSGSGGSTTGLVKQGGLEKVTRVGVATTSTPSPTITVPLSTAQVVKLTNQGTAPAVLAGFSDVDGFTVDSACPLQLDIGQSCDLTVTAQLTAPGTKAGVLNINVVGYHGAALALQATIPDGPQAALAFDRKTLDFGTIESALPASLTTKLSNTGSAAASVVGLTAPDPFSITSDCGTALAAGASCNVGVTLKSLIAKSVNAVMTLPQVGTNPLSVSLLATVKPPLTSNLKVTPDLVKLGDLSPTNAMFGSVTVTNTGGIAAPLLPIKSSSAFEITTDCGSSLEVGASCTINGQFVSTDINYYTLPLVVGQNGTSAVTAKFTAAVKDTTGKLANLKFTPSDLNFGLVAVGTPQALQSTLSNTGGAAATLASIGVSSSGNEFSQTNNCPEVLEPGTSCDVTVTVTPSPKDSITGMLSVADTRGTQTQLQLGAGGGYAKLSAAASVDFGVAMGNGGSAIRPVVLTNSGTYPLTGLSLGSMSGPFTVISSTCATTIDPKNSCSLVVNFVPNGSGSQPGSISASSENGGQATVALSGSGTLSQLQLSATDLTFPDTAVGSHAMQNVTLSNSGPDDAPLSGIGLYSGQTDYAQSNNCGSLLKGGAQCQVSVQFTPTDVGVRPGALAVTSSYSDPVQLNLIGTGFLQKLLVAPGSLAVGSARVGTTTEGKAVVVSNPSAMSASLTSISVVTGPDVFTQSNNCGSTLDSGQTCTISVQGTPKVTGSTPGKLSVVSSFGTYSAGLSVTGTIPKGSLNIDPPPGGGGGGTGTTVVFDSTAIGSTSPTRTVTFSNSGTGPLTITGISVTSGVGVFGQSNNCAGTLAPGESCKITMAFTPVASGTSTGALAILTSDGAYNLTLSGTASVVQGSWSGTTDFGQIAAGSSKQQSYTFTNTGSGTMSITTVLQGSDVTFVLNNCGVSGAPATLNKGEKCVATVRYSPSAYPSSLNGAMLSTTALGMAKPATFAFTGMATGYQLGFQSAPASGNFGTVQTGGTITRNITLTNMSRLSDTLAGSPVISGNGYSIASNTCTDGRVMGASTNCVITVALNIPTPASPGDYTASGTLTVTSAHGASAVLPLTAAYQQVAMALEWVPSGATFPTVPQGGGTASMAYSLTNKTAFSMPLGGASTFTSSDSRLAIVGAMGCGAGTTLSPNGGRCTVTVKLTIPAQPDAGDYSFQGTLTAYSKDGTPATFDISTSFTQAPYTFAWDRGASDFGAIAPGASKNLTVFLRNTSPMTVTSSMLPTLEGDSVFKFYSPSGCSVGATATANGNLCYRIVTATMPAGQPAGEYHYSATLTGGIREGNQQDSVLVTATMIQEPYTISLTGNTDFGTAKAGLNVSRTITLKNTTTSTIQTGLKVSYSNPQFSTYSTTCTGTLGVGSSCSYTVYGKGISGTTQTGDITVTSPAGASATLTMSITSP